ncbi:MAG: hypothetical protein ACQEQV_01040 [Fibrobacterota bacterium]
MSVLPPTGQFLLIRRKDSKIRILKRLNLFDLINEEDVFTSRKAAIRSARIIAGRADT